MKFSYSTANLIFFGFLIILLILPIFDRHKIGKFQTQKSLLGIRLWAITFQPIKRGRCLPQINAIKFLGNLAEKIFERQTIGQIPPKLFQLHLFCLIISLTICLLAVKSLILTGGQWVWQHSDHMFQNLLPIGFMHIKEQIYRRWLT